MLKLEVPYKLASSVSSNIDKAAYFWEMKLLLLTGLSYRWILTSVNLTLARMGLNAMIWEEIIIVPALMTMMERIVLISRTTARTILVKVPALVQKPVLMYW